MARVNCESLAECRANRQQAPFFRQLRKRRAFYNSQSSLAIADFYTTLRRCSAARSGGRDRSGDVRVRPDGSTLVTNAAAPEVDKHCRLRLF